MVFLPFLVLFSVHLVLSSSEIVITCNFIFYVTSNKYHSSMVIIVKAFNIMDILGLMGSVGGVVGSATVQFIHSAWLLTDYCVPDSQVPGVWAWAGSGTHL